MMGLVKPGLLPAEGMGLRDPTRPIPTGGLGTGIVIIPPGGDITIILDAGVGTLDDSPTLVGTLGAGSSALPTSADDALLDLLDTEFAHPFLWLDSARAYLTTLASHSPPQLAVGDSAVDVGTDTSAPSLAIQDASEALGPSDDTGTMIADDGSPLG